MPFGSGASSTTKIAGRAGKHGKMDMIGRSGLVSVIMGVSFVSQAIAVGW